VLPPVIEEGSAFPFKFWFDNGIQDGMYYRNDLFYRLYTVNLEHRARLYHHACRMAQSDLVVITATPKQCSIWVSLRSPSVTALSLRSQPLPDYIEPMIESLPDNKSQEMQ
jgi:hypothetical protein